MERFRTQLSKYAKIENFYASVISSDFGEILLPNHGFNIAKVVRLVGLVSGVLLIFVKIFLHFWKDLMSNLSKEATIETFVHLNALWKFVRTTTKITVFLTILCLITTQNTP